MKDKPLVVFTLPYGKENFRKVEEAGFTLLYLDEESLQEGDLPSETEVLVCYSPFNRINLSRLPRLKLIHLVSKGVNQVPVEGVRQQGIEVVNNGDATSVPIAEWIVAMILMLLKNSPGIHGRQRRKVWEPDRSVMELAGKRICILGTGNIAGQAALRLKPFLTDLTGINSTGRPVDGFDRCYSLKDLDHVLHNTDILVSTLPATAETEKLIDSRRLSLLKKGALFINISRGAITDEQSVLDSLESGHLKGAALDVFEKEPLNRESPLWSTDNLIITPHNSFLSDAYRQRVFDVVFENLKRYLKGETLNNRVDFDRGY